MLALGCARSAPPARVALLPSPPPPPRAAAIAPPAPRARAGASPFALRSGAIEDFLHDYAVATWGPNGPSAIRWNGPVADVGRYALVASPGGFWVRDFGDAGWVTAMEANGDRVVVRYTIRDDGGDADWKRWQARPARLPEITSVTHMVVEVWSIAAAPRVLFAHEYEAWASCCGSELGPAPPRVSDDVVVTATEVRLRARDAWRATRATFHETPLPGIDPVLAPWDTPNDVAYPL